jgi:hypothetical protein
VLTFQARGAAPYKVLVGPDLVEPPSTPWARTGDRVLTDLSTGAVLLLAGSTGNPECRCRDLQLQRLAHILRHLTALVRGRARLVRDVCLCVFGLQGGVPHSLH